MGGSRWLIEELRSDVLCTMNDRTDFNVISLHSVEDQMRLKPKAPVARRQVVNRLTYEWKIGKQPERSDQASVVGIGLITAELGFREVVDTDEIGAGALSNPVFSHGDAQRPVVGPQQEFRLVCRL